MTFEAVHAEVSWRKTVAHLKEAAAQDADASPMAVIHSSYNAIFHAARAVRERIPDDHHRKVQQFVMREMMAKELAPV